MPLLKDGTLSWSQEVLWSRAGFPAQASDPGSLPTSFVPSSPKYPHPLLQRDSQALLGHCSVQVFAVPTGAAKTRSCEDVGAGRVKKDVQGHEITCEDSASVQTPLTLGACVVGGNFDWVLE